MVFSGIVHSKGKVLRVFPSAGAQAAPDGLTLEISHSITESNAFYIGCSIAVNGVCLTVTTFSVDLAVFTVDLAPETLRRTNLGTLAVEAGAEVEVNLELPLGVGDRNSGHYVQGHVDDVVTVAALRQDGDSLRVQFRGKPDSEILKFVVEKGYVALDGASLTVCRLLPPPTSPACAQRQPASAGFEIMLIPHTQSVLRKWRVGELVNLEVDCMAKYLHCSALSTPHASLHHSGALYVAVAALVLSSFSLYKTLRA